MSELPPAPHTHPAEPVEGGWQEPTPSVPWGGIGLLVVLLILVAGTFIWLTADEVSKPRPLNAYERRELFKAEFDEQYGEEGAGYRFAQAGTAEELQSFCQSVNLMTLEQVRDMALDQGAPDAKSATRLAVAVQEACRVGYR